MKKQTAKTPFTKEDLTDILKEYPTKNDLKRELKKELKQSEERQEKKFDQKLAKKFTDSFNTFRVENNYQFSFMKEEIKTTMSKFTDLILTAIDPLLKELETRREDREIGTAQMEEAKNRLNNHEKRITELEHS